MSLNRALQDLSVSTARLVNYDADHNALSVDPIYGSIALLFQ